MILFEAKKAFKKIDEFTLLSDVFLSISLGEKVAIVGKNGSGKSSLLKLIGGIYSETEGVVKRVQLNIGYVPEHFPKNIRFKLYDFLYLVGNMSSKVDQGLQKRIEQYAELFSITEFLYTPLKNCSKGTKQKAGLIQALLHNPDLLLLDEPLTGLDDKAKIELLNLLNSLGSDKTIIFTAHDPLLIDRLADRVLTVESGRIVSDTKASKNAKVRMIKAKVENRELLARIPSITYEFVKEDIVEISVSAKESDKILSMLLEQGCSIYELTEKR
ncbi:ATP-binding cassette domain-containing protein [Bacillus sp. BGMRC 2118]|nr:ATP-binding cassette domain-containing protein [Bacillus sp. BGMRC 2118]